MSTKALQKQLVAAIAMVLVAAVALGSSTYAWFAANTHVEATGLTVTATTSPNLLIADTTAAATALPAATAFQTSLSKSVSGALKPVSTTTGTAFFYTAVDNVDGEGNAIDEEYTAYTPADTTAFNAAYKTTGAVGYVDYVFALKAENPNATAMDLRLTELDLKYSGATDTDTAFRSAVLVEKWNGTPTSGSYAAQSVKTLLNDGGTNFESGKAVTSTSATGAVTYASAASDTTITVAANSFGDATEYYRITVRLWLEGEDTTCTNATFADFNSGNWALSIAWDLVATGEASPAAVTALARSVTPATP